MAASTTPKKEHRTDAARTRFLEPNGIRVMRFNNTEVLTQLNAVSEAILAALRPSI
jgi:very-short-patch-repair endonuclease